MISGSDFVLGFWLSRSMLQFLWGSELASPTLSLRQRHGLSPRISSACRHLPSCVYFPFQRTLLQREGFKLRLLEGSFERRNLIPPDCLFEPASPCLCPDFEMTVLSSCPSPTPSAETRMWDILAQSLTVRLSAPADKAASLRCGWGGGY